MSIFTGSVEVDTAALAVHLNCTPAYVRLLVHHGIITPKGRWSRHGKGRPTMWFNALDVDEQLTEAEHKGLAQLDNGKWRVRNS
jgi:hypothetical protein